MQLSAFYNFFPIELGGSTTILLYIDLQVLLAADLFQPLRRSIFHVLVKVKLVRLVHLLGPRHFNFSCSL